MLIKNQHVDIWMLDKVKLLHTLIKWDQFLSENELQRAQRFHFEEDKLSFMIYHACKRLILSHYLNQAPQEIEIAIREKGKPYLSHSTITFNLSHTKDIAILAVADNIEIGVDIEKIKPSHDYLAIAKRFFHAQEYAYLIQIINDDERQKMFYRFWTAKEAVLKATGEGIIARLDTVIITLDITDQIASSDDNCTLIPLSVPTNYVGTLAALNSKISVRYQTLEI